MYGMPGQTQEATQSPYDQVAPYSQRPDTETLASQLGGAQTAQYHLTGQTVVTGATIPELAAPQPPSQYQSAYAPAAPASSFANTMLDPTQSSLYPAYGTQYTPQSADSINQAYQTQVRLIFTRVRDGQLHDAGDLLLVVSHYLLGNAEALTLTRDDQNLHDERIRLWDEFNRAWLVILQAQSDMTNDWVQNNQPVQEPRSIMTLDMLENLSCELVRLCDGIERHGLVDYQMGVAEEEIIDMLLRCMNQLDDGATTRRASGPAAESFATTSA